MPQCEQCRNQPDDLYPNPWGALICSTCFQARYIHCVDCGAAGYRGEYDGLRCTSCYHRLAYWHPREFPFATTTKKTTTARCFGIELETSSCPEHISLRGKTYFGVKEDGSIDGLEFYSPILRGDKGLAEVRKFCRLAKKNDFKVNEDCGFHLHIDMRDTTEKQRRSIAYAYRLTFDMWQQLVAEERWENCFCQEPEYTAEDIKRVDDFNHFARNQDRYEFVNIRALHTHSTYELRGYQGTLDSREICNWIKAHLRFVEAVKDKTLEELDGMFKRRPKKAIRKILGAALSNYYSKQWRKNSDLIFA